MGRAHKDEISGASEAARRAERTRTANGHEANGHQPGNGRRAPQPAVAAAEPSAAPSAAGQPAEGPAAKAVAAASASGATGMLAEPHGGRLLLTDLRVAYLLANEARYRALERLGVRREDANLATLILAGMLADSAHRRLAWLRSGPGKPTRADAILGVAVANELLHEVAGPSSRETPYFGGLVALALLGRIQTPPIRRSLHSLRRLGGRGARAFHHRYGYLLMPHTRRAAHRVS